DASFFHQPGNAEVGSVAAQNDNKIGLSDQVRFGNDGDTLSLRRFGGSLEGSGYVRAFACKKNFNAPRQTVPGQVDRKGACFGSAPFNYESDFFWRLGAQLSAQVLVRWVRLCY